MEGGTGGDRRRTGRRAWRSSWAGSRPSAFPHDCLPAGYWQLQALTVTYVGGAHQAVFSIRFVTIQCVVLCMERTTELVHATSVLRGPSDVSEASENFCGAHSFLRTRRRKASSFSLSLSLFLLPLSPFPLDHLPRSSFPVFLLHVRLAILATLTLKAPWPMMLCPNSQETSSQL